MKDSKEDKYTYTARKAPEPVDLQVVMDGMNEDKRTYLYHAFLEDDNGKTVALLGLYMTKQKLEKKLEEYRKNPTHENVTKVRIVSIPQAEFLNIIGPFTLAGGGCVNE